MTAPAWHLAQLNIARFALGPDAPENADFFANLDRINALAESQPGFVWRLTGEGDNATDIDAFGDPAIVTNMSVWQGLAALNAFVYRTAHVDIMRRRAEWFAPLPHHLVLWWIPDGSLPTLDDARDRLAHLAAHGRTPRAFTIRQPFPAPAGA